MLKVFRTDVYMQAVIIAVVAALLWARAIVVPTAIPTYSGGSLFYLLFGWMPPRVATLTAIVIIALEGLLLNGMLYRNKMINQNTLLPMLFFFLAMSLGTAQTGLTPLLAATLFIILCVGQLMVTGTLLSLSIDKTFGAAACLSLATLFCPSTVVFLLPVMMCMVNYSLYSWRDWTMLLLGLAAPYIPLEFYYYLTDNMFYQNYLLFYGLTDIALTVSHSAAGWTMCGIFTLLTLVAMTHTAVGNQSHGTNYTKNSTAIMLFFVGGIAYSLAYGGVVPATTQAYAVPFAFCTTTLFYDVKEKEWIWNTLLTLLLLAAAAYNTFIQ